MRNIFLILSLVILSAMAFGQTKPAKKAKKQDTLTVADKSVRQPIVVRFFSVFKEEENGDIVALYPFKIKYYTINKGAAFPIDGSIGGVRLDDIKGHDLLVDTVKGAVIYKGMFH